MRRHRCTRRIVEGFALSVGQDVRLVRRSDLPFVTAER
jgi:hypothetical protein